MLKVEPTGQHGPINTWGGWNGLDLKQFMSSISQIRILTEL